MQTLTVAGDFTVGGHIISNGSPVSATATVGSALVTGDDVAGNVNVTGTAGQVVEVTVNFVSPYNVSPSVNITPTNASRASDDYFVQATTTGFTVKLVDPASGDIAFNYQVIE